MVFGNDSGNGVEVYSAGAWHHHAFGFELGYFWGRLFQMKEKECRTFSIEVGMQNSGLGSQLAKTHFTLLAAAPCAISAFYHCMIVLCLLSVSCREVKHSSADLDEGDLIGLILEDVPVVTYGAPANYQGETILNLKIERGVIDYFWNSESVGKNWGQVAEILQERGEVGSVALRVSATSETKFSVVRSRIKQALGGGVGVSRVDLVVKRDVDGKPDWVLPVDGPMMGKFRDGIFLITIRLEGDGEILTWNESGVVVGFANLNELSQRLALLVSAAEVTKSKSKSKSKSLLAFQVSEEVGFGRFCEVFSCLRQSIDYVGMQDLNPDSKPLAPRRASPAIQRKPSGPRSFKTE